MTCDLIFLSYEVGIPINGEHEKHVCTQKTSFVITAKTKLLQRQKNYCDNKTDKIFDLIHPLTLI